MEKSKFSFALVFSLIVLLGYAYIAFLGMVYWQDGRILLPVGATVVFLVVVGLCLMAMCKAKATRWKRIGTIGQTLFGGIILLVFLASAAPFTNFLDVLSRQDEISRQTDSVMIAARQLDDNYMDYAQNRIENYRNRLELVSRGKTIRPSEYRQLLGGAYGSTDAQKIARLTNSLRMKLLPDSLAAIQHEREQWLRSAANMSVWNVMLPSNIARINEQVDRWTENYQQLAENIHVGEEARPFTYPAFNSSLLKLTNQYARLHVPSLPAVIVALLCFFIMLLPYWMTDKSMALRETRILYE